MSIKKKIYINILKILPFKAGLYLVYFKGYKKFLNLKNPQYFGEKLQWLKCYGKLDELSEYVDKYEVRNYVKKTIGQEYLTKIYGVYDNVEDIDFEKLPNKFVLKCTNGSGMNYICKNKNDINIKKVKLMMNKWLKSKFWKIRKELQYKNVKNRILIEEYLEDETKELKDYKFYCIDGKVFCYGIFYGRFSEEKIDFYDSKGKKLEGITSCNVGNTNIIEKFDNNIKKMIKLAEKLSNPFVEVRVDFYCANNKIYFGELTFTDGAGGSPFIPLSFDLEVGKQIKLGKMIK